VRVNVQVCVCVCACACMPSFTLLLPTKRPQATTHRPLPSAPTAHRPPPAAQVDKIDVTSSTVENVDMHLNMLRGAITSLGGSVDVVAIEGGVCSLKYKVGGWAG